MKATLSIFLLLVASIMNAAESMTGAVILHNDCVGTGDSGITVYMTILHPTDIQGMKVGIVTNECDRKKLRNDMPLGSCWIISIPKAKYALVKAQKESSERTESAVDHGALRMLMSETVPAPTIVKLSEIGSKPVQLQPPNKSL